MDIKGQFYAERFNAGGLQEERIRRCLAIFNNLEGDSLLDIGCGDGAITLALQEAIGARQAFGVDIAPQAVASAQGRGIEALQVDVDRQDLPFNDNSFDVVYCGEIIEHLFDPEHLLEEVRRVLKPGGVCVLTTPNLAGWPNRLALLLGFQPYSTAVSPRSEGLGKFLIKGEEGQWGHIRIFTLRALKELVSQVGLSIVSIKGCPVSINTKSPLMPLVKALDNMFSRFPSLATRVILVVRRE